MDQNENTQIKHESELETHKIDTRKLQALAIVCIGILGVLLLSFYFFKNNSYSKSEDKKQVDTQPQAVKKEFKFEDKKEQQFKDLFASEPTPAKQDNKPFVPASKPKAPIIIKGSGQTLIGNKTDNKQAQPTSSVGTTNVNDSKDTSKKVEDTDAEFTGDTFAPSAATLSKFNPSLLLTKGTYIGCSMNTRLVSDIKGGVACTVSENVYSENGHTLLIEKGSRITGMFKSGQLTDGMERIFVIWQEIRTPQNIVIPVYSGASDELGGSGMPGHVDHHWAQRFGASILLSVIDDASNFAMNGKRASSGSSNSDYTSSTRENSQQMANTALEKMINIQPTLYKNQGDLVGVYVNRDIDFSKVYKLVRKDTSRDSQ